MFELRDSTGVLGSFDSDGIRRLVRERRLHREMEVRQLPSGEWRPISKLKGVPPSAYPAAPPNSPPISESGIDLTTHKGSVREPEKSMNLESTWMQAIIRIQLGLAVRHAWSRVPVAARPYMVGVLFGLALLIGAAIGSSLTANQRHSPPPNRITWADGQQHINEYLSEKANAKKAYAPSDASSAPQATVAASSSSATGQSATAVELPRDSYAQRLSLLSGETERRIIGMANTSAELLAEHGIYESRDSLISAVVEMYPRTTRAVTLPECFAAYVTLRKKGESHFDAVEDMKGLFAALGVP